MKARGVWIALAILAGALTPVVSSAESVPTGQWLAGDLHVHTIWGHDTCITPLERWDEVSTDPANPGKQVCDEPWTWSLTPGQRIKEATLKGLDYLAISDHNNVLSQRDPEYLAHRQSCPPGSEGCLQLVPAYENSLAGHAQMLGATTCHDSVGPTAELIRCNRLVTQTPTGMEGLAAGLRGVGGAFQINHPSDRDWETKFEARWDYRLVPDTIEVWNIGPWFWQPPAPAANDNDHALAFWDSFLRQGHRVGATGGSDSHWTILDPVQGVGEPTTWVWVEERSPQGILQGIRAGRTTLSFQPPSKAGARLFLEADGDGDGDFESMVGDEVVSGTTFRVRATNAPPGSVLRIVLRDGWFEEPVTLGTVGFDEDPKTGLPIGGFVRAELRVVDGLDRREFSCDPFSHCTNRIAVLALTSPIYID